MTTRVCDAAATPNMEEVHASDRLSWTVAVPVMAGLSALLWAGIWFGVRAVIS